MTLNLIGNHCIIYYYTYYFLNGTPVVWFITCQRVPMPQIKGTVEGKSITLINIITGMIMVKICSNF